jgi:ATP-binding cassette, subfamily B, bacterial
MTKNFNLKKEESKNSILSTLLEFAGLLKHDNQKLVLALVAVLINSSSTILTPYLISLSIDSYISQKNLEGLQVILFLLILIYILSCIFSYIQTRVVGNLTQKILYQLRNDLFARIQAFPLTFFNQNSAGDIVSRLNNDTDKLNTFLSQSVFQFVANFVTFVGIGIFIFFLNWQLSIVVWIAVIFVVAISRFLSPYIVTANKEALVNNSDMVSFLDENLNNFKALVVFNKQDYLAQEFKRINTDNYKKNSISQILNNIFNPIYTFSSNIAQILVLFAGFWLVKNTNLSIGLLIAFIAYTQKFYSPLRILGSVWGTLQEAVAAWGRIQTVLKM